ncbi:MAG: 3-oxoadipate enol-lactonase [Parasphingorhabdus sp.]|jgi:3-oxoadipate enol-lactonase
MPIFQRDDFISYYEDTGSGEPLVLICGLSADLQTWRFLVPELSKQFRVIAIDNRGAGRSSAPDQPYSIPEMANDVIELLNHLNIASADVIGWSMGGVIAQSIALTDPEKVKHLVLLGSCIAADGMLKNAITNWVNIRRSNMPYEQVARYVGSLVYSPTLANNEPAYEAYIQAMIANPYRQSMQGFVRQAEAVVAYIASRQLGTLQIPTSVLVGEHDQLVPPYLSEQLAASIPNATLRVRRNLTRVLAENVLTL